MKKTPLKLILGGDMNKKETQNILHHVPVMSAFCKGSNIQYRTGDGDTWVDTSNPVWDCDLEYRIKPEPREFWLVKRKDNTRSGTIEYSERGANIVCGDFNNKIRGNPYEIVHVIEQL